MICQTCCPLITDVERQFGANVAALIRDGDCLGRWGSGPGSDGRMPHGPPGSGHPSELCTDWMVDLIERGCITGARKNIDTEKVVTSFCPGIQRLYDFIDKNPLVAFHPIEYNNDPYRIGALEHIVASNAAVQVDLAGQVNSESLGTRQMPGTGGLVDFVRGAARSRGGRSIIALPSTALGGEGRGLERASYWRKNMAHSLSFAVALVFSAGRRIGPTSRYATGENHRFFNKYKLQPHNRYFDLLGHLLQEREGVKAILHAQKPFFTRPAREEVLKPLMTQADAVVTGVGE